MNTTKNALTTRMFAWARESVTRGRFPEVVKTMLHRNSILSVLVMSLALQACGMPTDRESQAGDDPATLVSRDNVTGGVPVEILSGGVVKATVDSPTNTVSGGLVQPVVLSSDTVQPGGVMTGAAVASGGGSTTNVVRVIAWLDRPPYSDGTPGSLTGTATGDRRLFDTGNTYQNNPANGVYLTPQACPAIAVANIPASSAGYNAVLANIPTDLNSSIANCPQHRVQAASYGGVSSRRWVLESAINLAVDATVAADTEHLIRFEFFTCNSGACPLGSETRIATTVRYCASCASPFTAPVAPAVGDIHLTRDSIPSHVLTSAFSRASCTLTVATAAFNATENFQIAGRTYTEGTHFFTQADNPANRIAAARQIVSAVNADQFANAGTAVASFDGTATFKVWSLVRGTAGNSITINDETNNTPDNLTAGGGCAFTAGVARLSGGTNGSAYSGPLLIGDYPVQVPFGPVGYFHHDDGLDSTWGGSAVTSTTRNFAASNIAQNDLILIESGTDGGAVRRIVPSLPRANLTTSTLNLAEPLSASGTGLTYSLYHADSQQLRYQARGTSTKGQNFEIRNHGSVDMSVVSGVIWDGSATTPPAVGDGAAQITLAAAAGGADAQVRIRANGPGSWGNAITVTVNTGASNAVALSAYPAFDITLTVLVGTTAQAVVDLINSHPSVSNLVRASCAATPCSTTGGQRPAAAALANLTGGRGSNVNSVSLRSVNATNGGESSLTGLVSRSTTTGTGAQIAVNAVDTTGTGICAAPYSVAVNCTDEAILFYGTPGDTASNGGQIQYALPGVDFTRLSISGAQPNATITLERTTGAQARSTASEIIDAINEGTRATLFTGSAVNDRVRIQARAGGTGGNSITIAYVNNATPSVLVAGTAITVNTPLPASTTAAQVVALINNSTEASALVYASLPRGTNGTGTIVALGASALAGGAAPIGWLKAMPAPGNTGAGIPPHTAAAAGTAILRGAAATGKLVSSNPYVAVGIYWGGDCYPSAVTLPIEGISQPYAAICYTAIMDVTEGVVSYEVRAIDTAGNPTRDGASCGASGSTDYCNYPAVTDLIVDRTPPQLLAQYGNGTPATSGFQNQKVWVEGAVNPGAGAFQTFAQTVSIRGLVKDARPGTGTIDDSGTQDSGRTYVRIQSDYLGYDTFALTTDFNGTPVPATDADNALLADRGYYLYDAVSLRPGGLTNFTVTGWDQAGNSTSTSFQVQQFVANTTTPPSFKVDCIVDNVPRNNAGVQILACEEDEFTPNPNSPIVIRTQAPEIGGPAGDVCQNDPSTNGRFGDCRVAGNEQNRHNNFGVFTTGVNPPVDRLIVGADKVSFSGRFLTLDSGAPTVLVNGSGGVFTNFDIMPRNKAGSNDVLGVLQVGSGGNSSQIVLDVSVTGRNVRPGDAIALSSLDTSQSSNIGLFEVAGCTLDGSGACTGTSLTLNRVLPQNAAGMFYQTGWIWMANNLNVPAEGINNFTFVATDSLGNVRTVSMPILRDKDPPSIVIQGIFVDPNSTEPVEMQSVNPIVFITDSSLFFGDANPLTVPASYINIRRTDSNGEGTRYSVTTVGGSPTTAMTVGTSTGPSSLLACRRVVNECVGRTITFRTATNSLNVGESRMITASAVTGAITFSPALPANISVGDTFMITPATENFTYYGDAIAEGAARASSLDEYDSNNTATYSCAAGSALSGVNSLGQAAAATRASPTGAQTLKCDFSCTDKDGNNNNQCRPGDPLTYQIQVFAIDRGNFSSSADVTFSLVESSAGALLGGALGVLSSNPAVVSTLSDATGLRTLTLDQLSNSGVLYNTNYRIATLLGDPNQPITSTTNARANFYLDSRTKFGNLLGTVLNDPDSTGPAQSTAVTLSNVLRILLDNGVFDDVLPILDNPQILDPKARTNFPSAPQQGDASKMAEFTEELLRDVSEIATTCNVGTHVEEQYSCFDDPGPIRQTFDAIKATLDYDLALRTKNQSTLPRISGIDGQINPAGTTFTSAGARFQPVAAPAASPANVQAGDIITIVDSTVACNTSTAEVVAVLSNTQLTTTQWSAQCIADCGAGVCDYKITPPAGPSLNTIIELADTILFADLDGDGRGGEREAIQAILHLVEESMRNRTDGTTPYDHVSLLCTHNGGTNPCSTTATTATEMLNFVRGRNIQGSLDLFAELSDNNVTGDGTEFISQMVNLVNFMLQESDGSVSPAGATNLETMSFITRDMLASLFVEPTFTNANLVPMTSGSTRQNTRLNLLLRSIAALSYERPTAVTINFPSGSVTADNVLQASLSLIHTLANDPDDNPRGCGVTCATTVAPGSNPQLSIIDKLETPLTTLLKDSRFPTLLLNISTLLDPGTGISDFTAFQYTGTVREQPFSATVSPNPYTVNPPLLSVLTQFSKARIDSDADGVGTGELTPIDYGVDALNVLLTAIGTETGGDDYNPLLGSVDTDVCRENYFQGRTPMEKVLNVLAQLAQPAPKDPKDFDFRNRTLPDCHEAGPGLGPESDNRTYIRIILDALTDDPGNASFNGDDDGSAATTTSVVMPNSFSTVAGDASNVNGWDDVRQSAAAGFRAGGTRFHNNILSGSCTAVDAAGYRTTGGGDGLAVPQRTLDILPELVNTIARYGFDTSDRLTSIFSSCAGANCKQNNGYPTGTNRWLSGQRLMIDLGLLLDQPLQVGGGTTGIIQFEQSLTREFVEAIANLTSTQAVNEIVLLFDRMSESVTPITGTLKVPNTEDIARSTSLVRALADPDGDGDPLPDGIIDDVVPLIQAISAAGMTQQVLDMLRSMRACGVDVPSGNQDIRGGEFFLATEDVTLAMLDAFSGALKDSAIAGFNPADPTAAGGSAPSTNGAGLCPQEGPAPGNSGLMGGILDSNPEGQITADYPVNRGVLVGGDDLRLFAVDNEAGIGGSVNNIRVFAGNWGSTIASTVGTGDGAAPFDTFTGVGLSSTNNIYVGYLLTFNTGTSNATRSRVVTAYNGATGTFTVQPPFGSAIVATEGFQLIAPSQQFGKLGAGIDGYVCAVVAFSPYSERCGRVISPGYPAASSPYSNATPSVTGGFLRFDDTSTNVRNLMVGCDQRAPGSFTSGGLCPFRVRQMREPYNGCVGGQAFGGQGMGVGLSSAGVDGIPQNAFRDSRLDLILRQLNFLMDGGNEPNLTTSSFSTRLGNILRTIGTPDTLSGDPSILSIFMFGVSGPGSGETGPLQALLNDNAARSALAGTLNLFSQTAAGVVPPGVGGEDVFDRYPNFIAASGWAEPAGAACLNSATTCDGNAIHDSIDYQLLALQGILNILGNSVGSDATSGVNVTAGSARQGWSDDPSVLFDLVAQLLQEKYIGNLVPGLQIVAEATTAVPMAAMDARANPEAANAPTISEKIEAKAMSIITRRIARSVNGGEEGACAECNWPAASFPGQQGGILSNLGAAPNGVYEGPIQALLRTGMEVLDEWTSNRDYDTAAGLQQPFNSATFSYNNYLERSRFVALEDLIGVLTGATGGPKHLNKALTLVYDIVRDTDPTAAADRSVNKILSVQVGLSQRGVVDPVATNKSALDVIADFINTLVEDPTDCDSGTVGFQRGVSPSAVPADVAPACIYGRPFSTSTNLSSFADARPNQNAVFRDVGPLVERPIQPILDPTAFTSLSQLFAGGDNSKITGALPFLAAIVRDTNTREIHDKPPTGPATVVYRGVEYSAGVKIADALFADIQDLIPAEDENRYDPLLTDDLNRNGVVDGSTVTLQGFGSGTFSGGWFSVFDAAAVTACGANVNCPDNEFDNIAFDCSPKQNEPNGTALARCTTAAGVPEANGVPSASFAARRVQIGFTAGDGGVTLGNITGINAAFFDSLADLIALEDAGYIVNNQLPRTNTGQSMDQYTARQLSITASVDPSFNDLITALGDLLLASNQ